MLSSAAKKFYLIFMLSRSKSFQNNQISILLRFNDKLLCTLTGNGFSERSFLTKQDVNEGG